MSFVLLEIAAIILTLLMGLEMRRQQVPWRTIIIRCAVALAILTVMILFWRGR